MLGAAYVKDRVVIGQVVEAGTELPVAGATVQLGQLSTLTDPDGFFRLAGIRLPDRLVVEAPGYYPQVYPLKWAWWQKVAVARVRLGPRRLLVTAHDGLLGEPLAGVLVQGRAISRMLTVDGAELTHITPGTELQLTREGYATARVVYQGEAHLAVAMRPDIVQGVVRDADSGQPVPGATLYAGDQILKADDAGFYRITGLADVSGVILKAPGFRKAALPLEMAADSQTPAGAAAARCAQPLANPDLLCLDLHLTPFQARGLYIPFGLLSNPDKVRGLLDLIQATELNALVVDVKGDRGYLAYESQVPLAVEVGANIDREDWLTLDELLAEALARDIYTIARMVVFKDNPLASGRPELAVVYADGSVWTDGEGLGWGNPFREEVWDYNIAIAQEVAALGFDEIQFDYLRFPSDGDIGDIVYAEENTRETRTAAIREFTRRVTEALRPYGVFTSADVFGLTVWVEPESDMSIGQRVIDIAPLVDYLCPMLYPSTFRSGNLGYDDPAAHPYTVIYRSQLAAEERVPVSTRVRPWLQAYWYSLDEMLTQKQAAQDANASGWTFWNAGGVYDEELFAPNE
ncbi:MAG: hypothetical protein Kow0063_26240 [Anaerolineae bacterium]